MANFQNEMDILTKYFNYLLDHPINLISTISIAIPLYFVFTNFKLIWKINNILVLYVFFILLLELISGYYSAHSINNHFLYLLFYFLESICLYIYFRNSIQNKSINKINLFILLIVLVAILYNTLNSSNQINDYSISIQSLGFIGISIISFYYILAKSNIKVLTNSAFFWINTGSIIYFSGMLFVFLFITKILSENEKELDKYFIIYGVLIIVFRIFLAIGIYKSKYEKLE